MTVVTVISVGGVFGFFVLSFGHVQGTEFAPDGFSRREFVFYQIPLIQLQITPVVRWDVSNDLEGHLTRKKVVPSSNNPSRWDSVQVGMGSVTTNGEALILCNYLDATDEKGELVWLGWTKSSENAKKFKPFWKAIRQAAQLEAYFCVPDLFRIAAESSDPITFQKQIDQLRLQRFTEAADDYAAVGDFQLADRFYTAAVEIGPGDEQLQEKQAKTRALLDQPLNKDAAGE